MEGKSCDHCEEIIGITYYSLGPIGNELWEFCSHHCMDQWQDQNEGVNKVTTKKEI